MIQRRKPLPRSTKPLKRTRIKKRPRRPAMQRDPRFKDPRSHVTKDGRVRLYGEDMTDLRREVFALSGQKCEVKIANYSCGGGINTIRQERRCNAPINWHTFHLMHGAHGHGFRNDMPRSKEHPDGCIAGCADCHAREHGHY